MTPFQKDVPRQGSIRAIDGVRRRFVIEDEIICKQKIVERDSGKYICFQKIRFDDGRKEYRFTYYMRALKGNVKGRWIFGQYSLMIPAKQLQLLLREARRRKWEGI
jgi:hypothetical protein